MKEIEEFLDKVLYDENLAGFVISNEKFIYLKNYIINLKQENEMLKQSDKNTYETCQDIIYELSVENEKLKQHNKFLEDKIELYFDNASMLNDLLKDK